MLELLQQPWHWAFSGLMISFIMFVLLFFGKSFGMSSTLRTACAACGAGCKVSFFDFDWKCQRWNLLFAAGTVLGGFIASRFLVSPEPLAISAATIQHFQPMGINFPTAAGEGSSYLPMDIFTWETLFTLKGFLLFVLGGFLVGFGSRYAGGCTSGHAISGLSNLQVPSLITVVGFFIGGLTMTHFLLPLILKL
jgi:uncharacterized membrane protein YedE/YeeE